MAILKFSTFAVVRLFCAKILIAAAFSFLLAHNFIPHEHHHDAGHDLTAHHHDGLGHDHDKGNEDADDLKNIFSLFLHSTHGFTFTGTHSSGSIPVILAAILPENFSLDGILIPPLLFNPTAEHFVYNSHHAHPSGLRAPPAGNI